jgi:hypothetical protein
MSFCMVVLPFGVPSPRPQAGGQAPPNPTGNVAAAERFRPRPIADPLAGYSGDGFCG